MLIDFIVSPFYVISLLPRSVAFMCRYNMYNIFLLDLRGGRVRGADFQFVTFLLLPVLFSSSLLLYSSSDTRS